MMRQYRWNNRDDFFFGSQVEPMDGVENQVGRAGSAPSGSGGRERFRACQYERAFQHWHRGYYHLGGDLEPDSRGRRETPATLQRFGALTGDSAGGTRRGEETGWSQRGGDIEHGPTDSGADRRPESAKTGAGRAPQTTGGQHHFGIGRPVKTPSLF